MGVLIVGNRTSEMLERDGKRIVQKPAWQWLLEADGSPLVSYLQRPK